MDDCEMHMESEAVFPLLGIQLLMAWTRKHRVSVTLFAGMWPYS